MCSQNLLCQRVLSPRRSREGEFWSVLLRCMEIVPGEASPQTVGCVLTHHAVSSMPAHWRETVVLINRHLAEKSWSPSGSVPDAMQVIRQKHPGVYGKRAPCPNLIYGNAQGIPRLFETQPRPSFVGNHRKEIRSPREKIPFIIRHGNDLILRCVSTHPTPQISWIIM